MCRINTVYFELTNKCDLIYSSRQMGLIKYKEGLPFCVYFDTDNGNPICRMKDVCECVKIKEQLYDK